MSQRSTPSPLPLPLLPALDLAGRQIVVTGASGYLGNRLIQALVERGAHVRAAVRDLTRRDALATLGATAVHLELTDEQTFGPVVDGAAVVFHCAALTRDPRSLPYDHYYRSNALATARLAQAASDAGVQRFVHVSTVWVHAMDGTGVTTADSPRVSTDDPYSDSKREAEILLEQVAARTGLDVVIARPSHVYGPDDPTWTMRILGLLRAGRMVYVDGGRAIVQPIYIDDVVEGVLLCAERGRAGQAYPLCGTEAVTFREFSEYLAPLVGGRGRVMPRALVLPVASLIEAGARVIRRPPLFTRREILATLRSGRIDGSKAHRELGFTPHLVLAEGVRRIQASMGVGEVTHA